MAKPPRPAVDLTGHFKTWRRDPAALLPCPTCSQPLKVTDKSARPYAEWYAFQCSACGFDQSIHIPLAGPSSH
jgi:predicted RNA-binding Zn-ribbon protein involved in translation (DUF1610 family)